MTTFLDLFNKVQNESIDPAFEDLYGKETPDLRTSDRLQDLMRALNANSKLLLANLSNYEKLMSIRFKRDAEF